MNTQTAPIAQSYPKSNGGGFKTLFALVAGIFLFYAVQSHLITDAFIACLSLVFDNFSVKATGIFPDLILLLFFVLFTMGAWHLLKFYRAAIVIVLIIATIVSVMFSDNSDPAKQTNGLKIVSAMAKGGK